MLRTILSRLKATLHPGAGEARLRGDIEEHLAALTDSYMAQGLSERDARLAASRDFGSVEGVKERYRDQARFRFFEAVARDLRFALRQCRKAPGFTALAIASLGLGIGANTALFSLVNAILLQRLPVPDPQQLVVADLPGRGPSLSYSQVQELDRDATLFDGIFGRHPMDVSVATDEQPRWVAAELVTGDYFRTLRISPARGRLITPADLDNASGDPVCDVSYRFWQNQLHGDPNVVGRKLRINMREYRIAGVTERGFAGAELQQPVDLQLPATRLIDFMPAFIGSPHFDWKSRLFMFTTMGRLRPGVNYASAESELTRLNEASAKSEHLLGRMKVNLVSGQGGTAIEKYLSKPALILLAVSGVVLLIACANLATLLIARTTSRAHEFAVRLAIGCSPRRVMAQVMTESALLAVFGTGVGVAIAYLIEHAILGYLNRTNPAIHQLHVAPDQTVLWFAIGVSVLCVLLFGTAPAIQAARTAALGSSPGNTGSGALVRQAFVAVQIALSLVVLFSAGLLTRTLSGLKTIDLGYRPDEIAIVDVRPAAGGYSGKQADAFYSQLTQRVRAVPGIKGAATAIGVKLSSPFTEKLYPKPNGAPLVANIYGVSAGYFNTIGARLIEGRDFDDNDQPGKPPVVIINARLAKTYFGDQDPVGRLIAQEAGKVRVIGVVSDVRDQGLRSATPNTVYQNAGQLLASSLTLLARCDGPCGRLMPTLRKSISKMDPNTPILAMHTMQTEISATLSNEQILSFLSALFAILAILLTAAGLYGITSYVVSRRTREIGLRVAIGASVRNITELLAKEIAIVVATGVGVGVPAALAAVQFLRSQLFGVTFYDPIALMVSVLGIAATAFLACLAPLRRALRIAPQQALRID